jgi:hypothetical protein
MGQQETTMAGSAVRRMILALLVAAFMAAVMATSAVPAMAAVSPENPRGKPIAAGDIFLDPPGQGPTGRGSVGATVNPCTGGADVFNHNRNVHNCQ